MGGVVDVDLECPLFSTSSFVNIV